MFRFCAIMSLILLLAACARPGPPPKAVPLSWENSTPYYFNYNGAFGIPGRPDELGTYEFSIGIHRTPPGPLKGTEKNAHVDAISQVFVDIDGQSFRMQPVPDLNPRASIQRFKYTHETPPVSGFHRVRFRVIYTALGGFWEEWLPGEDAPLQIPVLGRDEVVCNSTFRERDAAMTVNIDGDRAPDGVDLCPFIASTTNDRAPCTNANANLELEFSADANRVVQMTNPQCGNVSTESDDGNIPFCAFRALNVATAAATEVTWQSSYRALAAADPLQRPIVMQVTRCTLEYQDKDGGYGNSFLLVYAAEDPHDRGQCTFSLTEADPEGGTRRLATGGEVLIVVQTAFDNVGALGLSKGDALAYGRVTLDPDPAKTDPLLLQELTGGSPTRYAYFTVDNFDTRHPDFEDGTDCTTIDATTRGSFPWDPATTIPATIFALPIPQQN